VDIVDGGTATGIDAALDGSSGGPGGGGMRGVVTDAQSGSPIQGIRVRCIADDFSFVSGCSTVTAADGSYQLAGFLPEGDYFVSFRGLDGFWAEEWYDDVMRPQQATPVAVSPGSWTDGIDAALEPAGGISGTVTNQGGGSFPLLTVTAYSWNGSSWVEYASTFAAYDTSYELTGLPEDSYRVRFRGGSITNPSSGIVEFYDDVASVEDGTDVPVLVGQITTSIDAVLGNIQGVEGALTNPDFNDGIDAWEPEIPTGSMMLHSDIDLHQSSDSGSAQVLNRTGAGGRFELSQCVAAAGETRYMTGGWVRVSDASGGFPLALAEVNFFAEPECGGSPIAGSNTSTVTGDEEWARVKGEVASPVGTVSARFRFSILAGSATSFDANIDELFFTEQLVTFVDDFESGDMNRWSAAVGGE
jgi:hypothetical protein